MFNDLNEETITAMQNGLCVLSSAKNDQMLNFTNYIHINAQQDLLSGINLISTNSNLLSNIEIEVRSVKFNKIESFTYKWNHLFKFITTTSYRR